MRRLNLAGWGAALACVTALLGAGGSTADQPPSLAGTAKVRSGCQLTASKPTVATDKITGTGSIRCKTSRTVHLHIETQTMQVGRWGTLGSKDNPFVQVRAGRARQFSTGPVNCKGLGQVQVRTVLRLVRFPRTLAKAISRTAQLACSGHPGIPGPNASCEPAPQSPTSASGHISASGTVTCSARATLNVDLQLQVYYNGGWLQDSDAARSGFAAAANTTYSFTTPATVCGPPEPPGSPPPPPEQWRSYMTVDAGSGPITKISPVVVLTTC